MSERVIVSYDLAKVAMDRHIEARGYDRDAVYSWLVVDEDYEDGCEFTRKQLIKEVDAAWKLEMRARVIERYLAGPHIVQLGAIQRRAIARHLSLNWEGIDVNLKNALSLSLSEITSLPVRK